nr:hypothetical protein [Tanacetum cinerariifolium]
MSSLFANTHNVAAILEKSDAADGFEQIIDFLSGSYIHYALTVSPHIYISCIKQFWNTASVKRSGDVTRSKFYMYPRFIQLIIQNQVGDLSTHTTRFISAALTQKVFANMRRVGKGFSGVETPLFEGMLAKLVIVKLKARVKKLEMANKVKSSKLRCLRKVGTSKQVESSDAVEDVFNQGRMIDDMDKDEEIDLVKDADIVDLRGGMLLNREDDSEVQEVVDVVTTAKLITEVVTAAASQIKLDAEYARKLHEEINRDEFNKDIVWDAAMDHVNQNSNNPQYIKRYQGMKKR